MVLLVHTRTHCTPRRGFQTGLCTHIFRLLRRRRVPWVLLENVPGLLMWHMVDDPPQPPAIHRVVSELEALGYRWAQRVIGLTGFGLPQRRRRVFILASLHGDPRVGIDAAEQRSTTCFTRSPLAVAVHIYTIHYQQPVIRAFPHHTLFHTTGTTVQWMKEDNDISQSSS